METMSEIPKFKFLNKLSPSDTVIVQIQEGKYKDVEFYYLKVNMESLEEGKLVFEYNILEGEAKQRIESNTLKMSQYFSLSMCVVLSEKTRQNKDF